MLITAYPSTDILRIPWTVYFVLNALCHYFTRQEMFMHTSVQGLLRYKIRLSRLLSKSIAKFPAIKQGWFVPSCTLFNFVL